ncbi:MAG: DNA adenine methylase [Gammaproteobacteria bacterium]|nr:MAG: DNA adenine methylase [Gammaproteobacteria bacterium]
MSAQLIRYYGSKWHLASWIVANFPPHTIYVEPFGGSAAVLLQKQPSPVEVLNDIDGEVTQFFRVLREQPEALARAVMLTPYSREEAELSWEPSDDPIEAARRFLVRSWQTIGGPSTRWRSGWRFKRAPVEMRRILRAWKSLPEAVMQAAERLRDVVLERRDYRQILAAYDGPGTLFYLDPPYLQATRSRQWKNGGYRHEVDHGELLEALRQVRGAVVLSGYPSPLYDEALQGWGRCVRGTTNSGGRRVAEVLWLNRPAQQATLF